MDRVAHAAWVYSNLRTIRQRALLASDALVEDRSIVHAAFEESAGKLNYLLTALRQWSAQSTSLAQFVDELFAGGLH
jgi:hypothetical protein